MEHASPPYEHNPDPSLKETVPGLQPKPTRPAPNSAALREVAELEGIWRGNHPIKSDASPEDRVAYDNTAFIQAQLAFNLMSFGEAGGPYTLATTGERQQEANVIFPEGVAQHRELEQAANIDALTGVGSRLAFEQALKRTEHDNTISKVSLDLDNFKRLNDGYNHSVGDAGIKFFAGTIVQAAEDEGVSKRSVFRQGGDEFALVIDDDPGQILGNAILARINLLLTHAYSERLDEVLPDLEPTQSQVSIGNLKDLGLGISGVCASSYSEADSKLMAIKKSRNAPELLI